MNKKIIIANWKMNGSINFIENFMKDFRKFNSSNEVIISVPFPYILMMNNFINSLNIKLSSQDISVFSKEGAFTGEVSGYMLKDCSVDYVIVGHSERRNYFKEDEFIIKNKLLSCMDNLLIPILCIGEDITQRNNFTYKEYILDQLKVIEDTNIKSIIVAYEPIWSIGSGISASIEQIEDIHKFIFNILNNISKLESFNIIYGGSVNDTNYKNILNIKYVDGVLVGGVSLDCSKFKKIVENI